MAEENYTYAGTQGGLKPRSMANMPTNVVSPLSSDEDLVADVDEPPDYGQASRPAMRATLSFKSSFVKTAPPVQNPRKTSLLTSALHSPPHSPTEEPSEKAALSRGLSCASTWSNNSTASTAELTSDGGFTSPGTRTSTPSPPLPSSAFRNVVPVFNKTNFNQSVSIVRHEDEHIGPLQNPRAPSTNESNVEATLGRKRCITFACAQKETANDVSKQSHVSTPPAAQQPEPPKRVCSIKFACPTKVSSDAPSQKNRPRRLASPAPPAYRLRESPKTTPKAHRDSDSTVRNPSPLSVRKPTSSAQARKLSINSDMAKSEAYRFHEFASSADEEDEWTQESTCHRSRLTVSDTLRLENGLRQLAEEAEEEALDDEQDEDDEEEVDDVDEDDDEDVDEDEGDGYDDVSDEGFQTDDEGGLSDDGDSDGDSDYRWWAPGSTAATSVEHLEHIRSAGPRSLSPSSIGSTSDASGFMNKCNKTQKKRSSRPVNIRSPGPELPDSTDFVCGTLDEDRPLEEAYMSNLERRRAAKHQARPQDIDPTFPASDPEMDEEDEDDEPDHPEEESDQHLMMHGQMDQLDYERRGRPKEIPKKRSPAQSPKRLRSPPPTKRLAHRSPPPRRLFGHSPQRLHSPPKARLRSPPPTRRGSEAVSKQTGRLVHFALADRRNVTVSSSLPRTPVVSHVPEFSDNEDTCGELPTRRAIDIKVGLEQKRLRRKAQLYQKQHRKSGKDKEKRPVPGKGAERMRDVGLGLAAHRGKAVGLALAIPPVADEKDAYILSV